MPIGTVTRPSPLRSVMGGGLALAVAMGIGRFAYTPILPAMQQVSDLDTGRAGLLASANYAGYLAGALLVIAVPPGAARHRILIASLVAVAVTTGLMAGTNNVLLWGGIRFLSGVASAGVFVLASGAVLDMLRRQGRVALSGWLYAGIGLGIALSGFVVRAATGTWGWRGDWLLLALLATLAIYPCGALVATNRRYERTKRVGAVGMGWYAASRAHAALRRVFPRGDGLHCDRNLSGDDRQPDGGGSGYRHERVDRGGACGRALYGPVGDAGGAYRLCEGARPRVHDAGRGHSLALAWRKGGCIWGCRAVRRDLSGHLRAHPRPRGTARASPCRRNHRPVDRRIWRWSDYRASACRVPGQSCAKL